MRKEIIGLIFLGLLFALIAPVLFTRGLTDFDFTETGQIGDTIGGTTAPIIGVLSILLLFYTLWEQIRFNKKQKEISTDEQFKSTFFNLLQVQRDILDKISGGFSYLGLSVNEEREDNNVRGGDYFKSAKRQLQCIYEALDSVEYYNHYDQDEAFIEENQLRQKSNYGPNMPLEDEAAEDEMMANTRKPYRTAYTNDKYRISKKAFDKYQSLPDDKKIGLGYALFFYKYDNMGYYFRHLYRILKFIKMHEDEKVMAFGKKPSKKEKKSIHKQFRDYAQFIQAQMSTEELVLLFYNSFAFDKAQKLIIHYELLENLTIQNLIKIEHNCKPELKLKDKKYLFSDLISK